MKKIIVAIDGYSSCGKSTMAKELAKNVGYVYVDTGAMYRAVSLFGLRNGIITDDTIDETRLQQAMHNIQIGFKTNAAGKQETYLNGENVESLIRTLEVANGASRVSAIGFVRRELVRQQQRMGIDKGIVMDGRHLGTVVSPDAELQARGQPEAYDAVLANVKERDYRDTHRAESPLRQADDAVLIDNSHMTKAEQSALLQHLFDERTR